MRAGKQPVSGYDAFISYSQAVSGKLAAALQLWLERFATPWYRPRSLRIFRDYTSLSASDDLGESIEHALSSSAHFILLASPEAAKSKWVNREVRWWRENKPTEKMFIVLTSGELRWDPDLNDWARGHATSLPEAARGMFKHEPLWVDLSSVQTTEALDRSNPVLLNSVAQIAAPLRGVDKDTIVGEHIAYYRRARLQRRGGVAALAIVATLAVVAASIARIQANNATHQAQIATSRALAAAAVQDIGTNLRMAQLLAVEAYRLNPDFESRSALFQVVTASPGLVRYLSAGSTVTTVAASGNGEFLFAGTRDGDVFRWSTAGLQPTVVDKLRRSITSVSASYTGATVAAADSTEAIAWTRRGGAHPIQLPPGQLADVTAVSPSGQFVLVTSHLPHGYPTQGSATLYDMQTGLTRRSAVTNSILFPTSAVAVPSDLKAVLFSAAYGAWEQLSLPSLTPMANGSFHFGVINYASGLSPDGDLATYSNGNSELAMYAVDPTATEPQLQVAGAGPIPTALAISANDQMAATAASGSIEVARIGDAGTSEPSPIELQGSPDINSGALAFVGNSDRLIAASGSSVAFWNLSQFSRIAFRMGAPVEPLCAACAGHGLTASPGGQVAAVLGGELGGSVNLLQLNAPFSHEHLFESSAAPYAIGPIAWSPDGRRMYVPTSAGIEVRSGVRPWHSIQAPWPDPMAGSFVKAISVSADGNYVTEIGSTNVIEIRNARTGKVIQHFQGPSAGNPDNFNPYPGEAAISPAGTVAAIVTPAGGVDVINLATHRVVSAHTAGVAQVAIGGNYLAVLLYNGSINLWSLSLNRFVAIGGKNNIGAMAINTQGTLLAEYTVDGTVTLQVPATAETIGTVQVQPSILGTDEPSLAFSPDGTKLVVAVEGDDAGYSGGVEQLPVSGARWAATACATAGEAMTETEWRAIVTTPPPANLACDRTS